MEKILVVEPDSSFAEQIGALLAPPGTAGREVWPVTGLDAALDQLHRISFTAILLNLDLPGCHGVSALQQVRAAAPATPVIIVGAHDDAAASPALQAGAQDHLTRAQLTQPALERSLRYALSRQHAVDELRAQIRTVQREVSEHRRLEEDLRASEEHFRLLAAISPVGLCLTDTDGYCQYVNPRWCEIAGLPVEKALGTGWLDGVHPADRERAGAAWQTVTKDHPQTLEYRFQGRGGQVTYVQATVAARLDALGRVAGYVAAVVDLTERKRAEAALRESESQYRSVFAAVANPLFVIDAETAGVLDANEAASRLYGYTCAELRGLKAPDLSADPAASALSLERGDTQVMPRRHRRKDGTAFPVNISLNYYEHGGRRLAVASVFDMTEYYQVQAARRESETRFRTLSENALVGIYIIQDGRLSYVNPAVERIFGFTRDELIGADPMILVHPDDAARVTESLRQRLAGETQSVHYEYRARCKTGEFKDVEALGVRVDLGGRPAIIGNVLDVTARKQVETASWAQAEQLRAQNEALLAQQAKLQAAEQSLREGEARFRALFAGMDEGMALHQVIYAEGRAVNYRILEVNPQFETILHLQREAVVGRLATDVYDTPEAPYLAEYSRVAETGQPYRFETFFPPLNQHFHISVAYIGPGQFATLFFDITERKLAEEAVRAAAERTGAILQTALDGFWRLSLDAHIIEVNDAYCRMSGYSRAELLTMSVPDVEAVETSADTQRRIQRLLVQGSDRFESQHRRKDGRLIDLEVSLQHLPGAADLFVFLHDITERRQAEAAMRALNVELERRVQERTAQVDAANQELSTINQQLASAVQARDEFLASMSHELRTPLTGILGLSEALQMGIYGALTDKQRSSLRTIYDSGQHLLALIADILDLSKAEAGKLELQTARISVVDVCQASQLLVRGQANKKHLRLTQAVDGSVTTIAADERRLKQILVNLLGNAVKFTPEGGKVGLEVVGDAEHGVARFTVWDTGIGIAPEVMSRLFKPFVQLDNRLNRETSGTGLGLALVHQLVTLHGGSITLESEGIPGRGSRFTVSLPWQAEAAPAARKAERDEAGLPAPVVESRPILVADDNPTTLAFLADTLAAHGYQVRAAVDGADALSQARELKPALLVLDVQMPGLSGLDVMRRLRSDPAFASMPIIALTALVMPGDRERCLAAGASEYLTKPVSMLNLYRAVERLLGATRSE